MTESPFEPPSGGSSAEPFTPPYPANPAEPEAPAQQSDQAQYLQQAYLQQAYPQQANPQQAYPQQYPAQQQPYGAAAGFQPPVQPLGYWQQPAPAGPGANGRSRRTLVGVLGTVALIAAFGIGLATGRATAPKSASAAPIATSGDTAVGQATAAAQTGGTPPTVGDLVSALIPLPSGASTLKVSYASPDGAMTLDQFMKQVYASSPGERTLLQARGFQSAATRWFNTASGQEDCVFLIAFGSPAGAQSYALGQTQAREKVPADASDTKFDVPGLTDGTGFEDPTLDAYGNVAGHIYGALGDVAILVDSFTPAKPDRAQVLELLNQQITRLSAYEQKS